MFKLTNQYSSISTLIDKDTNWENNHIDNFLFCDSFENISKVLSDLKFEHCGSINSHHLTMGFSISLNQKALFKHEYNDNSYIQVDKSNREDSIGNIVAININRESRELLGRFCHETISDKFKSHKVFGIGSGGFNSPASLIPKKHIELPGPINFDNDYGHNFNKINDKITELLSNRNNQLIIMDGPPGTGKTSYIRYLVNNINKKFVFTNSQHFYHLTDEVVMEFTKFVGPTVVVVEDAEDLV